MWKFGQSSDRTAGKCVSTDPSSGWRRKPQQILQDTESFAGPSGNTGWCCIWCLSTRHCYMSTNDVKTKVFSCSSSSIYKPRRTHKAYALSHHWLLFKSIISIILCDWFFACMYICVQLRAWCPQRPEPPRTGVISSCEPPRRCQKSNPEPLEENMGLLTVKPPPGFFVWFYRVVNYAHS